MMMAKVLVPAGGLDTLIGGGTSSPSHVNCAETSSSSDNFPCSARRRMSLAVNCFRDQPMR